MTNYTAPDRFEYELGSVVYLKTDKEQERRIVTGILVRETGVTYAVTHMTSETWHYGFELSDSVDVGFKLS